MSSNTCGTGIKLSGHWNLSGLVYQIKSLSTIHQPESALGEQFCIDCSEINSVDMSGLQLLYTWMQCVSMRGVKPALINLPEAMQQAIRTLGLENCFLDFSTDLPNSCCRLARKGTPTHADAR